MFPDAPDNTPYLTTEQMIEVDRLMMEDYGIDLPRMMENAGRTLAHLARVRFLAGDPRGKRVIVLAGTGGNGGGALVSARRLHNYGADVRVALASADLAPVPAQQLAMLRRMGVPVVKSPDDFTGLDLIIDGVIGYSLKGDPRDGAKTLIEWANFSSAPVLALDAPSGVDTTSGQVFDPAIRAKATLTLALPKEGLRAEGVRQQVGELYLADISVPPGLYAEPSLGLTVGPVFAKGDILRLF